MFIRKTSTLKKKDGSTYQTFRLVESIRVGEKVRQRTLLNLGADFSVPRDQWGELTGRIEDILAHRESLFPYDVAIGAGQQTGSPRFE